MTDTKNDQYPTWTSKQATLAASGTMDQQQKAAADHREALALGAEEFTLAWLRNNCPDITLGAATRFTRAISDRVRKGMREALETGQNWRVSAIDRSQTGNKDGLPPIIYSRTIYELTSSGINGIPSPARYFGPADQSSACVRFAEEVVKADQDISVGAAWVCLKRLPDSIYPDGLPLLFWTKTSDESSTKEGALTPEHV